MQGNLDHPLALLAGGSALDRGVYNLLAAFSERPFIYNLEHGILPHDRTRAPELDLERRLLTAIMAPAMW